MQELAGTGRISFDDDMSVQRWHIVDPVTITPEQTIADALEVVR
jgi:hypothetical protein